MANVWPQWPRQRWRENRGGGGGRGGGVSTYGPMHHHYSSLQTSPTPSLPLFLMIHHPRSEASLFPTSTPPCMKDCLIAGWQGTKTSIVSHRPACLILQAWQASDALPCNPAGSWEFPISLFLSHTPFLEIWCSMLTQPDRRATKTTLLGALEWEFAVGRGRWFACACKCVCMRGRTREIDFVDPLVVGIPWPQLAPAIVRALTPSRPSKQWVNVVAFPSMMRAPLVSPPTRFNMGKALTW